MPTTNAPDLRIAEAIGRLVAVVRDSQRTCIRALRDCIDDLEDGQTPNLHRYELALRAHHERAFAGIARERITELAHDPDLVAVVERAADSYERTHAPRDGQVGVEWAALRAATRRVVVEVKQAMLS